MLHLLEAKGAAMVHATGSDTYSTGLENYFVVKIGGIPDAAKIISK